MRGGHQGEEGIKARLVEDSLPGLRALQLSFFASSSLLFALNVIVQWQIIQALQFLRHLT